ncbi:MAG: zinc ABC transporter substrate-binding protein [Candidatus Hydrogenedentota bacterium]
MTVQRAVRTKQFGMRLVRAGVLLWLVVVAGCGPGPQPSDSGLEGNGALPVAVSIPPLSSLVERIGGEQVRVDTLLAPGEGPHTFSPKPKQVMALGKAAVYFHVGGFPFELELAKRIEANFPSLTVQDVSEGIGHRKKTRHQHDEENSDAHEHEEETDPHVWMSPPLLKFMAKTIAETLQHADSSHAEAYQGNLEETLRALDALDGELREKLAPHEGRTFYIYHPALGYFAERYGLEQESVEVGGKKPTPRQLQHLIEQAKEDEVPIIFVQPQFDQRSAEAVAEAIGGEVNPLDPLRKDVFANLREIGSKLSEVFSRENPS